MIQEVMTVHKALCELKMLDKRHQRIHYDSGVLSGQQAQQYEDRRRYHRGVRGRRREQVPSPPWT